MMEVSTGTAHQAMRLLADRNILERRPKQGTYVGAAVVPSALGERPRVYVLSPIDSSRNPTYSRYAEALYPAIAQSLDGASLQLEFLPAGDSVGFIRTLAHEATENGNLGGFVLVRSTYEVQEFFQEHRQKFPAVIVGSPYPGITSLPYIDCDQRCMGNHLASYILRAGHRRVVALMNDHWAPGANRLISGMAKSLNVPSEHAVQLEITSLPPHERSVEHCVRELLSSAARPSLILAHTVLHLTVVLQVASELKLRIPEDIDVVMSALGFVTPLAGMIPHFVGEMDPHEMGEFVGRMLVALRKGEKLDPFNTVFPVKFVERQTGFAI
jgi:DNA-binding LacI/PurR family transcriptional regulator